MDKTMHKHSKVKSIVLFISAALIALSAFLFMRALTIRDFGTPGGGLFSGQSSALIVVAFALLSGLAIALLVVVSGTWSGDVSKPASAPRQPEEKAATTERHRRRTGRPAPKPDTSSEPLPDAAGESSPSVGEMREEPEEADEEIPVDEEHTRSLLDESDRIRKIVEGMDELARAQALGRALKKQSIEVQPLLSGIIEKTRLLTQGRDVAFNLECETGLTMTADPDCLGWIMGNLMNNAAKAVKQSGSVTLSAATKGGQVVFTVADTGTGIRPRHRHHIFERFFRGTGSGIGLGLTIVKELVDACGGNIEVQTKLGEGTVITVSIPAV